MADEKGYRQQISGARPKVDDSSVALFARTQLPAQPKYYNAPLEHTNHIAPPHSIMLPSREEGLLPVSHKPVTIPHKIILLGKAPNYPLSVSDGADFVHTIPKPLSISPFIPPLRFSDENEYEPETIPHKLIGNLLGKAPLINALPNQAQFVSTTSKPFEISPPTFTDKQELKPVILPHKIILLGKAPSINTAPLSLPNQAQFVPITSIPLQNSPFTRPLKPVTIPHKLILLGKAPLIDTSHKSFPNEAPRKRILLGKAPSIVTPSS